VTDALDSLGDVAVPALCSRLADGGADRFDLVDAAEVDAFAHVHQGGGAIGARVEVRF